MPDVCVIIVSWNDCRRLARCLEATSREPVDIIVIDNASADGSAEMVATRFPSVHLIRAPRNLGFAGGVNAATAHSSAPFILLLNPDAVPEPGAIGALHEFLADQPRGAGATGLLLDADGRPQIGWNIRRLPTRLSLATELLLLDRIWPRNPIARRHNALDLDLVRPSAVEQPAAACLMLRREAFDAIGGFDERFHPAWFEDVDFCARLRDADGLLYFVPHARFLHDGGASREQLSRAEAARFYYRNLDRFAVKRWGRPGALPVRASMRIGLLLRAAISLVSGDRQAAAAYLSVRTRNDDTRG